MHNEAKVIENLLGKEQLYETHLYGENERRLCT